MIEGIEEYEAELLAKGRAQIAKEDASWNALPQSEKDRINADRERMIEGMFDAGEGNESDDAEDDDEGED